MKETQQDIFQLLNKLQNDEISVQEATNNFIKMKNFKIEDFAPKVDRALE